jgi:hypothetical protein
MDLASRAAMSVTMHKLPKAATNRHPGENFSGADDGVSDASNGVAGSGFDMGLLGFLPPPEDLGVKVAMPLLPAQY